MPAHVEVPWENPSEQWSTIFLSFPYLCIYVYRRLVGIDHLGLEKLKWGIWMSVSIISALVPWSFLLTGVPFKIKRPNNGSKSCTSTLWAEKQFKLHYSRIYISRAYTYIYIYLNIRYIYIYYLCVCFAYILGGSLQIASGLVHLSCNWT